MAAYVGNSDDEPGRRSRIKTDHTPGMFENVQSVKDFATCISVPLKAIALAQPTGETCSSKADKELPCLFPAIQRNRGCCVVHCKTFYPLLGDRGDALMGPQYLRPPSEVNHRGCDCEYSLCRQMGYFPSKQGAIKVPVSARDVTLRSPNLFSPTKKINLQNNNKQVFLCPWHFYEKCVVCADGKWSLNYDKNEKKRFYDADKFSYESPPPRQSPRQFIHEEFSSFVRPKDKSWLERDSNGMPEWMWDTLRIDDANAGNTDRTPKKLTLPRALRLERMWRARAHHLENKISTTEHAHNAEMIGQNALAITTTDSVTIMDIHTNNKMKTDEIEQNETTSSNLGDYELKRAQNIERNNAKLRSLGLLSKIEEAISNDKAYKNQQSKDTIQNNNEGATKKRRKMVHEGSNEGTVTKIAIKPSRKSARIRGGKVNVELPPPPTNIKEEREQRVKECREARLRAAQEVANQANIDSTTIKSRAATYDHCLMRVKTMSEKALLSRIKRIERAAGKHCVVKMAIFKCCLQDEGLWDLATLAEDSLERLKEFILPLDDELINLIRDMY